jgi:hypothetical protein
MGGKDRSFATEGLSTPPRQRNLRLISRGSGNSVPLEDNISCLQHGLRDREGVSLGVYIKGPAHTLLENIPLSAKY